MTAFFAVGVERGGGAGSAGIDAQVVGHRLCASEVYRVADDDHGFDIVVAQQRADEIIVTSDNPKRENDRCSIIPGILIVVCSIGKVISLSISAAPKDGEGVITKTWLLVISGTASIGSLVALYTPNKMSASTIIPTINLLRIENAMILLSMIYS